MKKGFTLLELLIVLVIISVSLTLLLPVFIKRHLNNLESYENGVKTAMGEVYSLKGSKTVCVNFKDNYLSLGNQKIFLPSSYQLVAFVEPMLLVSAENHSKFCFTPSKPTVVGFVAKGEKDYLITQVFFPVGEVEVFKASEADTETYKDKIQKGRVLEWFSYFSSR